MEQRTKLFREALHAVVAQIEATVLARAACPECGGALVSNGRVPLVLETLVGRLRQLIDALNQLPAASHTV